MCTTSIDQRSGKYYVCQHIVMFHYYLLGGDIHVGYTNHHHWMYVKAIG